jgi:hypothetical protein
MVSTRHVRFIVHSVTTRIVVVVLVIAAIPFVFSALFVGALMGARAAFREAIDRGIVASTCPNCGEPIGRDSDVARGRHDPSRHDPSHRSPSRHIPSGRSPSGAGVSDEDVDEESRTAVRPS